LPHEPERLPQIAIYISSAHLRGVSVTSKKYTLTMADANAAGDTQARYDASKEQFMT